jgi:hypothetical protein
MGGGEQGIVLAATNILARVKLSATLAYQDIARQDFLAGITLDAKAFGF